MGSGKRAANNILVNNPSDIDILKCLELVIHDSKVESVGGAVQYGYFEHNEFKIRGVANFENGVQCRRGALDINSESFMGSKNLLIPGFKYLDPFNN